MSRHVSPLDRWSVRFAIAWWFLVLIGTAIAYTYAAGGAP